MQEEITIGNYEVSMPDEDNQIKVSDGLSNHYYDKQEVLKMLTLFDNDEDGGETT